MNQLSMRAFIRRSIIKSQFYCTYAEIYTYLTIHQTVQLKNIYIKYRSIVHNPIQKLQAYAHFKNHPQFVAIKIRNIMKNNNNMKY